MAQFRNDTPMIKDFIESSDELSKALLKYYEEHFDFDIEEYKRNLKDEEL